MAKGMGKLGMKPGRSVGMGAMPVPPVSANPMQPMPEQNRADTALSQMTKPRMNAFNQKPGGDKKVGMTGGMNSGGKKRTIGLSKTRSVKPKSILGKSVTASPKIKGASKHV